MTDIMEDFKNDLIKSYTIRYFEGVVDTIDNIQKALIAGKMKTGQYPTMEDFIYKILPEIQEENKKKLEDAENEKV